MSKFILFAHRGASGYEPENTLSAFERALAMGARWIELDVYAVEGELIVIHDERLERTTNGTGFVMKKSLAYLRNLDAGKGQKIPFLSEVFDLIGNRAGINVELKGPGTASPTANLISAAIIAGQMTEEQFIVSSFNRKELLQFNKICPEIRTGILISGVPWRYARLAGKVGAFAVHAGLSIVNKSLVTDVHRRGLKLFVYTLNNRKDMERMQSLGVDGAFTDYPDLLCV
jgi:glycerophosphoryl diester phosphodiesterase